MGYGHLRPAYTLADALGAEVTRLDAHPAAGAMEKALWKTANTAYSCISRACDQPAAQWLASPILDAITKIEPMQSRPQSASLMAHFADRLSGTVIGRRFRKMAAGSLIVATYPVAALAARHAKDSRVFCLATDTDLSRAWAAADPAQSNIVYFAPTERAAARLRSFGVPHRDVHLTGFPLPEKLVSQASAALARRLLRLDPQLNFCRQNRDARALIPQSSEASLNQPISMMVAIGGAGAQTRQAGQITQSLRHWILEDKLRLTLVAGVRHDVASALKKMIAAIGLEERLGRGIDILLADALPEYFKKFDDCLNNADVVWTKPSELVFYASLGAPLLLAKPLGAQEHANRNWLLSEGAAIDAGEPALLADRLEQLLATGELCQAAWNAFSRLRRDGSERIREIIATR